MTTYSSTTLSGIAAAQFDGTDASFAAIQAICRDARLDPTMEKQVRIPLGAKGRTHVMTVGDWVTTVATGQFLVLSAANFAALLQ